MKDLLIKLVLPNLKAIIAFIVLLIAQAGIEVPTDVVDYFTAFIGALAVWLIPNKG